MAAVICGMLRVKNEARWIGRALDSIVLVCDRIVLMDDGSTDGTPDIAAAHGAIVLRTAFAGRGYVDEAEDKDWLLTRARTHGAKDGDWAMMIDGDEALAAPDLESVRALAETGAAPAYSFRILYLWDSEDRIRTDGVYGRFRRPSFFQLAAGQSFRRTGFGGNFHCSSVPADLIPVCAPADVRLLHFGYLHRGDRIRKYRWYNSVDGKNAAEDGYRHIAQGDLPELPADARFMYAGPLTVVPLEL